MRGKIKAIEIARELGISKATVSLALNGKEGVSEETRKKVFECKEMLASRQEESSTKKEKTNAGIVQVVWVYGKAHGQYCAEVKFDLSVFDTFQKEIEKYGYTPQIAIEDLAQNSMDEIWKRYKQKEICGVILFATELSAKEIECFENISKPLLIYDNESPKLKHNCVMADNKKGVRDAVHYLREKGYRDIIYLQNECDIYNFGKRREGFIEEMNHYNITPYNRMLPMGTTIDDVKNKMKRYLKTHDLPQAYIMENYQISTGVIQTLHEEKVKIPEQIALVGVDEVLPETINYMYLTSVSIPHKERVELAMMMLEKEIRDGTRVKSRILMDCKLVKGKTS